MSQPSSKSPFVPKLADRLGLLPPYLATSLNQKAMDLRAQGVDVISFAMGDPDLPTPQLVIDALTTAAQNPDNHNYPPVQGISPYRETAGAWLQNRFGVSVCPETEITGLIGSKEGLAHLIMAMAGPGDVVLVPSPGYPVYRNYTLLAGAEVHTIPLLAENDFLPDLAAVPEDIRRRAKLLFLNYPNNPTGAIAPISFVREAIEFCRRHEILLCHDNAYSEMTFDGYRAPSFLEIEGAKEVCVEMFSLSKMYNMTGWRIGFAAGNATAIKGLVAIKSNTDTGIFKPIQHAAIAALNNSETLIAPLCEIYTRRRDIAVEGLRSLGWDFAPNVATFYLWVPVPEGMTSAAFAEKLLTDCAIVVPPGHGYGPAGEGFFRMALTIPEARLKEAFARMKEKNISYRMYQDAAAE